MLRLYRTALRLYPGEFRDEYGRELILVLNDRLRGESSATGRLFIWLHALLGILVEAPLEHLRVLAGDLHYALRVVRREKAVTLAAVSMLALGIGAATIGFTLVNGVLLRPLPYASAARLVAIDEFSQADSRQQATVAYPNYLDIRARTRTLDAVGVYVEGTTTVRGSGGAEQIDVTMVDDGVLAALGVRPALGRAFTPQETAPHGPKVVIIGGDLHRRRFGSDPGIVGKMLDTLDGRYTIVGVMPRGFHFPHQAQAWMPLPPDAGQNDRTTYFLASIGRMQAGATIEQADAEMRGLMEQIHAEHQPSNGWMGRARPLRDVFSGQYRGAVLGLLAGVGVLLLIACGNVSNLLLVRASTRSREMSVRTALGATRRRLVRQLITESLVLGAAGGVGGVLIAGLGVPAVRSLVPIPVPTWMDFSTTDWRVLGFAVAVSFLTSMVFGTMPALNLSRGSLVSTLKEAGRGSTPGGRQRRIRHAVVVGELALSMTLLAAASLAGRSFLAVRQQALGYRTQEVLTVDIERSAKEYPDGPAARALLTRIRSDVAAIPGVASTAFTTGIPLEDTWGRIYSVEGQPQPIASMKFVNHIAITPGYFRTLDIPVLRGRDFTETDFNAANVIVSRSFATRHFPDGAAIGRRVRFGPPASEEPWHTIVGVVADTRHAAVKSAGRPNVYLPYGNSLTPSGLLVRAKSPLALADTVRARIAAIDRDLSITRLRTLEQAADRNAWQDRFLAVLVAAFAAVALALAAAGFYAVLSYAVSMQTHEIGVRMALGASASSVRSMVMRQAMGLAGRGLVLGLMAATVLAFLLRTRLYNVSPLDPVSYVVAPAVFLLSGGVAAYLPSRRATRVDPMVALRHE